MELGALRDGTDLLRVLDTVSGGLLAVGADDTITYCNPEFVRYFGLPAGRTEWTGATHDEALRAIAALMPFPDGFRTRADELLAGGVMAFERVSTADERTFERDYLPMSDGDGHVWHYWDVTEQHDAALDRERLLRSELIAQRRGVAAQRVRAAAAERTGLDLAERNRRLVETDGLRQQLVATASHELRTPLTTILNFSEMLGDDIGDGPQRARFLTAISRNAARMLELVDDLLLLARIGSGAPAAPDLSTVDLTGLVGNLVADVGATSPEVSITAELAPDVVTVGSPESLERALANVLGNAVKYSDAGATVEVVLRRVGTLAQLQVIDHGIGIPPEEIDQVFGQFYRASTARESGRPGTGLGLAIVRGILDEHDATIALSSAVGAGTVATITFAR